MPTTMSGNRAEPNRLRTRLNAQQVQSKADRKKRVKDENRPTFNQYVVARHTGMTPFRQSSFRHLKPLPPTSTTAAISSEHQLRLLVSKPKETVSVRKPLVVEHLKCIDENKEIVETAQKNTSKELPTKQQLSPAVISESLKDCRISTSAQVFPESKDNQNIVSELPQSPRTAVGCGEKIPDSSSSIVSTTGRESPRCPALQRERLDAETKSLLTAANHWENVGNDCEDLPDSVRGEISSTVGQIRLLVSSKFKQFRSLIDEAETPDSKIKNEDLEGFWEMVYLNVIKLEGTMEKLEKLQLNNWQPPVHEVNEAEQKAKKRNARVKKPKKVVAPSRFHEFLAKQKALKNVENDDPESPRLVTVTSSKLDTSAIPPPFQSLDTQFNCDEVFNSGSKVKTNRTALCEVYGSVSKANRARNSSVRLSLYSILNATLKGKTLKN